MSDTLSIKIQALLEPTSMRTIKDQIDALQEKLNAAPLTMRIEVDGSEFKRMADEVAKLNKNMPNPFVNMDDKVLDSTSNSYTYLNKELTELSQQTDTYTLKNGMQLKSIKEVDNATHKFTGTMRELTSMNYKAKAESFSRFTAQIKKIKIDAEQAKKSLHSMGGKTDTTVADKLVAAIKNIKIESTSSKEEMQKLINRAKLFTIALDKIKSNSSKDFADIEKFKKLSLELETMQSKAKNVEKSMKLLGKDTNAGGVQNLINDISELKIELGSTETEMNDVIRTSKKLTNDLSIALQGVNQESGSSKKFQSVNAQLTALGRNLKSARIHFEKLGDEETVAQIDHYTIAFKKLNLTEKDTEAQMLKTEQAVKKLKATFNDFKKNSEAKNKDDTYLRNMQVRLEKIKSSTNATVAAMKGFGSAALNTEARKAAEGFRELNIVQGDTRKQIQETIAKATTLQNRLSALSKTAKATGNNSMRFGTMMKTAFEKFSIWISATTVFFALVRGIKAGIGAIVELDEAITNLKKVSDELKTSGGVQHFLQEVNELAIKVGHNTKDAIDSITEFKKLGYTLSHSQELAGQALVYSNISDQEIADSTKSIISSLKGFGLAVEDVNRVMDAYNEVGNNFSITSGGIGQALQRSASALNVAGNTLEESIGLVTAMNASVQNPEKVGTALKTVSMRIRGISEESGEAIPKLDKLIKNITGVDIMKDSQTFKSTFDIIRGISEVWDDISDTDRATLLEKLFGKRQGDAGASLLSNFEDGLAATETALNSLGSAAEEQAKYMKSVEATINKFSETVVKMWTNTLDSGKINWVVNLGTNIIKLIDIFGLFNSAIMTSILLFFKFNTSFHAFFAQQIAMQFQGIATAIAQKLIPAMGGATLASAKLALAIQTIAPIAALTAIMVFVNHMNEVSVTLDKQKIKVEELIDSIGRLKSDYQNLKEIDAKTPQQERTLILLEKEIALKEKQLIIDEKLALYKTFKERKTQFSFNGTDQVEMALSNLKKYKKELATAESLDDKLEAEENIRKEEEALVSWALALDNGAEILGAKLDPEYQKLLKNIMDVIDVTDLQTISVSNAEESLVDWRDSLESTFASVDELSDEMDNLSDAYDTLSKGESLATEDLLELINLHPKLASYIAETGDLTLDNGKILKQFYQDQKDAKIEMLSDEEIALQSKLDDAIMEKRLLSQKQLNNILELESHKKKFEMMMKMQNFYNYQVLSDDTEMHNKKMQNIQDQIDLMTEGINRLKASRLALGGDILGDEDKSKEDAEKAADEALKNELEGYEAEISAKKLQVDLAKERLEQTDEDDAESRIAAINDVKDALGLYQDKIGEVVKTLENKLRVETLTEDQREEITKSLEEQALAYEKVNTEVFEYNEELKDLLEIESGLEKHKENVKSFGEEVLKYLKKEIEKVKEKNELLKEQEEREQKLLEIQKQKEKIANIEKEFNHKQIVDGVWTNVIDNTALREENETLDEMEQDYEDWEAENDRQHELDAMEKFYDQQEELIETFAELNIENFENMFDEISDELRIFVKAFNDEMAKVAAINIELKGATTGRGSSGGKSSLSDDDMSIAEQMAENSRSWWYADEDEQDRLHDANVELAKQLEEDSNYDSQSGEWNVLKYHDGGFVGGEPLNKKHEVVAKFLKGELAIPPDQLNFASKMLSKFTLPSVGSNLAGASGNGDIIIQNLEVHANDADDLVSQLKNLSRLTVKR